MIYEYMYTYVVCITGKLAPGSTVVNDMEPCGDGDHVSLPAMTIKKRICGVRE